jgi:hypothetical protein
MIMRKIGLLLAVALLASFPAFGGAFTINNTGLGTAGAVDSFWTITADPDPAAVWTDAYKVTGSPSSYPFTAWAANATVAPLSAWIAPRGTYPSSATQDAAGTWVFTTTFTLSGIIPGTASISGQMWADNAVTDVILNGNSLGITTNPGSLGTATGFTVSSGFQSGLNTLSFNVLNRITEGAGAGPVGFRAQFETGTGEDASQVPEPATFGLIGIGLFGLAAVRRSRKNP